MRMMSALEFNAENSGPECHLLTYAEDGFAPLNIHTRHLGLPVEQLHAFASEVNSRHESGTLYPIAPISAVPRALVRERVNAPELAHHIGQFLKANESLIEATTLVCDFRTPGLGAHVIPAIEAALRSPSAAKFRDVIVLT